MHCGICLPAVSDLPRAGRGDGLAARPPLPDARGGRGRLPITEQFTNHLDLCLGCRACETACPAGVRFGSLLETARADIERHGRPWRRRWLTRLLFAVFPHPDRLGPAARPGSALSALGPSERWSGAAGTRALPAAGRDGRSAEPRSRAGHGARVPAGPRQVARPRRRARGLRAAPPLSRRQPRHGAPAVAGRLGRRRSARAGCCGALELHAGHAEAFQARGQALAAALPEDVEWVVTNAAGCGAAMRDYGHWLPDSAAARLAGRVRDVTEVLARRAVAARTVAADRRLSRRLSSGPRPEGAERAARAAPAHPRPDAGRAARQRPLLRERGHLQYPGAGDGRPAAGAASSTASSRAARAWWPPATRVSDADRHGRPRPRPASSRRSVHPVTLLARSAGVRA